MTDSRQDEIAAACEEMEALYQRGIRDVVLARGVQGEHLADENCWCCPEIRQTPYGTLIIHRKVM